MKRLFIALAAMTALVLNGYAQSDGQKAGPYQFVTTLPATCTPAQGRTLIVISTNKYYVCTATNTWSEYAPGLPGSSHAINRVYASPSSGGAGAPLFRSLVAADLPTSGVTAGSYTNTNISVDAFGRVTAASNGSGGGGSSAWNAITNPTGNLSLNLSTFSSTFTNTTGLTTAIQDAFTFAHDTSGTPSVGFGIGNKFRLRDNSGAIQDAGRIQFNWLNQVSSQRTAQWGVDLTYSGSSGINTQRVFNWRNDRLDLLPFDTTAGSTQELRFNTLAADGKFFGIQAPDSITVSRTVKWPSTTPSNGQTLTWTTGDLFAWATRENPLTFSAPLVRTGDTITCPTCGGGGGAPGGSANSIQINNGAGAFDGNAHFTYDVSSATAILGSSSVKGKFGFRGGTSTNLLTFQAGAPAGNYVYTLPDALPTTNQTLAATAVSGNNVTLGWASGGGGGGITSINSDTTAAQTITGANGLTAATSSGTTTIGYAPIASSGAYFAPVPYWEAENSLALVGSANEVRGVFLYLPMRVTFDRLAINGVTTGTGNASFGVWASDRTTKICDSGAINTTTAWTGAQTITPSSSCTVGPGFYWWTWTADNATATARATTIVGNWNAPLNQGGTVIATFSTASVSGMQPASLGTPSNLTSGGIPISKWFKN